MKRLVTRREVNNKAKWQTVTAEQIQLNALSSGLLTENVKIKTHRSITLPVVLLGLKLGL